MLISHRFCFVPLSFVPFSRAVAGWGSEPDEDLALVHEVEDEPHDGDVAHADGEAVPVVAYQMLQAVEEGAREGVEAEVFGHHVGGYGVHAEHLEPGEAAAVMAHIDDVIDHGEGEEAVAAGHEHHGAGPDVLDDGHLQAPQPSGSHHGGSGDEQREHLGALGAGAAEQLAGEHAAEHGDGEGEAADYPGVGVPGGEDDGAVVGQAGTVAVDAQHGAVNFLAEVALGREVAATHGHHQQPVGGEECHGEDEVRAGLAVEKGDAAHEVAYGDGLQGVAEETDVLPLEPQQVALDNHAAYPQQHHAAGDADVGLGLAVAGLAVPGHGEGDGDAGHEHEQGHDDVPQTEPLPIDMFESGHDGRLPAVVARAGYQPHHGAQHGEQEQVHASQDIQ